MKNRRRVTKSAKNERAAAGRSARARSAPSRAKVKSSRRAPTRVRPAKKPKRLRLPMGVALEFYRPLKKPITLRVDADVLAWFKKDGRHYQTRINRALRKVMEREMTEAR